MNRIAGEQHRQAGGKGSAVAGRVAWSQSHQRFFLFLCQNQAVCLLSSAPGKTDRKKCKKSHFASALLLLQFFSWRCPGNVTVMQSSAHSLLPWCPQATKVQGIRHIYFPLGEEFGMLQSRQDEGLSDWWACKGKRVLHACALLHSGSVRGWLWGSGRDLWSSLCLPRIPTSPWLRAGSAVLGRAQTLNNNAVVVHTAPCCSHRAAMGQGLDNLLFSLEKPLQAADTCCGRLQKTWCGGLPLPFAPIPSSLAQLLRMILAFHSARGAAAGWFVTESLKELSSLVAWLWAIFSFPSPPCLHQHPKSTAAIGPAPRGAAQHVLVTGWTSRQRQRGKSEACKYL